MIPEVKTRDAYWEMKRLHPVKPAYKDIRVPKNTPQGIYIAIFAFLAGFGFVWEIVWLVVISILGIIVCAVVRTFDEHTEYTLTAAEVEKIEKTRAQKAQAEDSEAGEDMGLWEFVRMVSAWALKVVRGKRWRTH